MLETRQVGYDLDDSPLFDGVDTQCKQGQLKVIFGDSGAGKTTFIRLLSGFETATRGDILLDGNSIEKSSPRQWRRRVVLLHQQPRMFPGTVEDNLRFAARYHNQTIEPEKLLERCQLGVDLDQRANTLSGGEQQRLALGRALSVDPHFLLLDEPTASLHEDARRGVDQLVMELSEGEGVGIYFVTHNPREVRKLGTDGYYIDGGQFRDLDSSHIKAAETP